MELVVGQVWLAAVAPVALVSVGLLVVGVGLGWLLSLVWVGVWRGCG